MSLKYLKHMEEATEEAKKSMNQKVGNKLPRIFVGAVLVDKKNNVLGKAHKVEVGTERFHAEYQLLINLPDGKSNHYCLFTTLEPCCFRHDDSRLPSCTQVILAKKIKRVIVGVLDPHPKISGKSIKLLKKACVEVTVLENLPSYAEVVQKIKNLNSEFFNFKWE